MTSLMIPGENRQTEFAGEMQAQCIRVYLFWHRLKAGGQIDRTPQSFEGIRTMLMRRLEIEIFLSARRQLKNAFELQIRSVKATRLPTISLRASDRQSGFTPAHNVSTYDVGGSVDFPIFTGRIEDLKVPEGDQGEAGQVVAVLSCSERAGLVNSLDSVRSPKSIPTWSSGTMANMRDALRLSCEENSRAIGLWPNTRRTSGN